MPEVETIRTALEHFEFRDKFFRRGDRVLALCGDSTTRTVTIQRVTGVKVPLIGISRIDVHWQGDRENDVGNFYFTEREDGKLASQFVRLLIKKGK